MWAISGTWAIGFWHSEEGGRLRCLVKKKAALLEAYHLPPYLPALPGRGFIRPVVQGTTARGSFGERRSRLRWRRPDMSVPEERGEDHRKVVENS